MNWIPGLNIGRKPRHPRPGLLLAAIMLASCTACGAPTPGSAAPTDPDRYRIDYEVRPDPGDGTVEVTLRLAQSRSLLRELRFSTGSHYSRIAGDGELSVDGGQVTWRPPTAGGSLRWRVEVGHRRNGDGFDAWLGPEWALFRAEDIVPRAATRTLKGASSETWLNFELPEDWSVVTEYYDDNGRFRVDKAGRRFDQPSGWMVMGKLGVRRETIAGSRVAVAGPVDQAVRRMDILAFMQWTLPELARVVPELPHRLTIVSAGEPMWRGGLSAPQSLFVHSDRPLISENATSTLLHELLHVSLGFTAVSGYDWILEGLAEYYSLELLRRSGSISAERHELALADLLEWSSRAQGLCGPASTGARTALAVMVFAALDREIRDKSGDAAGLDNVVRHLWGVPGDVDIGVLRNAAEAAAGAELDALHIDSLPGCRSIGAATHTG
ncbi:MAG TPA: hypothetical protein VLA06_08305 [Woeseiaceae bacterium]|jgi:hypothetical protein|nr:hypothetical protein [Woeseiaceae bacterium]